MIMAYVPIGVEKKKEVIKDYLSGGKITNIAKKHGVSRDSIYEWSRLADEAISSILEERGHMSKIEELENDNKKLKEKLSIMQQKYTELSQISQNFIDPNAFEIQPVICDKCGCSDLWKNGTFTRTGYNKKDAENLVKRYTCSNCKANIYVVKKNSR